jgi:putative ABC transport system ATP-binding protein
MKTPIIDASGIFKTYRKQNISIPVLRNVDLCLEPGAFLGVMGVSGSGKSTLLNILGCLDRPTSGSYRLDGMDVLDASDDRLSHLRSRYIGFVFQTFNLIPTLTVAENVELPFLYQPANSDTVRDRVQTAVDQVGLAQRRDHRPTELSGGEMQRAAIARALAMDPKLILADEPTGNLDSQSSRDIMGIFKRLHGQGRTIIMVTHNPQIASMAESRITLNDGQIVETV